MNKTPLLTAVALLIGSSHAAHAAPVIYDFTGSGSVCTYIDDGISSNCAGSSFTGIVTIDVLETPPGGPTGSYRADGWVRSDFLLQWDDTAFDPSPFAGTQAFSYAAVYNDLFGTDLLQNEERYNGAVAGIDYYIYANMQRFTSDTMWLSDLAFDTTVGIAPGDDAINTIAFGNITQDAAGYAGYFGTIDLRSLDRRATPIPEPGTWAMLGLGFLAVGLFRRSHRT